MLYAVILSASLAAAPSQTDTERKNDPQEEEQEPELTYQEVVVVTAAKTEQRLIDAGSLVTAFTPLQLKRSPAVVIDDQLRRVPGFSLFRRSSSLYSHPTTQGTSLRGIGPSGASRSLVLWNGIPLNDPFGNWIYWNRLPALSNERIEVVRGAATPLYGSSALAGTIQLIPRPPTERTLDARLQVGNLETYDVDVFASHRTSDWGFIVSGRIFDTKGYIPIREEEQGSIDIPANTKFQTFLGRLEYRDFHVGVNVYNEDKSNGTPAQQNKSHLYLVETGYDADTWSLNFYGQGQELESQFSRIFPGRNGEFPIPGDPFSSTGFGSSFTMRTDLDIQWGVDWRRSSWEENRQNFLGAFVQYLFTFDERWDLLLGGRFDLWENQSTQGSFNPRVGLTFRGSDTVTVRGSAYRGFRAPSLNELYRPFRVGSIITVANANLSEEHIIGVEGGVDIHPTRFFLLRLNAFHNSLEDPVSNVTLCTLPTDAPECSDLAPATIRRQRQNLGSATINGFEVEASYVFANEWSLHGGYLLSDSKNDDSGLVLPQASKHQGNVGIGYDGSFQFTADLRLVGDAFDDDRNQRVLPRYGLFDLSLRVPLSPKFAVYVAVENLFDEDYVVRTDPLDRLGTPRFAHGGIELRLFR